MRRGLLTKYENIKLTINNVKLLTKIHEFDHCYVISVKIILFSVIEFQLRICSFCRLIQSAFIDMENMFDLMDQEIEVSAF